MMKTAASCAVVEIAWSDACAKLINASVSTHLH